MIKTAKASEAFVMTGKEYLTTGGYRERIRVGYANVTSMEYENGCLRVVYASGAYTLYLSPHIISVSYVPVAD